MKTIFLTRHGRTDANVHLWYQGQSDIPLNAEGLAQADSLVERLHDVPLAGVYCSPLKRAFVTGQKVAEDHGLEAVAVPDFIEMNFGQWEGLTFEQIHEKFPQNCEEFFAHPGKVRVIGGENVADLRDRAMAALDKIVEQQEEMTAILVAAHGGTLRAIVCGATGLDPDYAWNIAVDNTSITCLVWHEGKYTLKYFNNVPEINVIRKLTIQ